MRCSIRHSAAILATFAYSLVMVAGYSLHLAGLCDHSHAHRDGATHCCHSHGHAHCHAQGPVDQDDDPTAPEHDSSDCVICTFHHLGQVLTLPATLPASEPLVQSAPRSVPPPPVVEVRSAHRSRAPPV